MIWPLPFSLLFPSSVTLATQVSFRTPIYQALFSCIGPLHTFRLNLECFTPTLCVILHHTLTKIFYDYANLNKPSTLHPIILSYIIYQLSF